MSTQPNRRQLLQWGSYMGLLSAPVLSSAQDGKSAAAPRPSLPPAVGQKFYADGRAKDFIGNTIICHVPRPTPLSEALIEARDRLRALSHSHKLAFLPPSSHHMTVFEGASIGRRQPGHWFKELALDVSQAECDSYVAKRLRSFDLDCELPLRLKAAHRGSKTLRTYIKLDTVDEAEERKLRRLRDRLAAHLQFREPRHVDYEFHITLCYLIDWLSPAEEAKQLELMGQITDMLLARVPVIELGAPEFCTFQSMFAFDQQFYLKASPQS